MWKTCTIISALLIASKCQDLDDLLNSYFSQATSNEADTVDNNCADIVADLKGSDCFECYFCNSTELGDRNVTHLTMISDSCASTEFCCLPHSSLSSRDGEACGIYKPEGDPRGVRSRLREVLQGEYPWRAWLYNSNNIQAKPFCAATLISDNADVLVTAASCIKDHTNENLFVTFNKNKGPFFAVQEIIIHKSFQAEKWENDIALIHFKAPKSKEIRKCCLPSNEPNFGSTCLAVSADDNYVDTAIPQQKRCTEHFKDNGNSGLMCAMAPGGDYPQETGSALICLGDKDKYTMYGIVLYINKAEVTIYTKVIQYVQWIEENIDIIMKKEKTKTGY